MANNKYHKEDMYDMIRSWESSGATQELFLKDKKIARSTFGYWRKKYLRDKQVKQKQGFIPVHIAGPALGNKSGQDACFIELTYPNGVQLKCSDQIDLSRLKTLIVL